ncbi:MAG: hypothetical protein ACYS47_03430, partial [Planctomycetota bacterium]
MATQIDLYFAEYAIKKGYASSKQVQECFNLLARLKREAGLEDNLHGVMLLKGYVSEEEANVIRSELLGRDIEFPEITPGSESPLGKEKVEVKADPRRYRFYLDEALRKEGDGDLEGALTAANKAKPYAEDPAEIDAKIADLDRRLQEKDRVTRFHRYQAEIREKAGARQYEEALHICRVARGLADDPTEMDSAIASLRVQAWKQRERTALKAALSGDLREGVNILQGGRALVDDPSDVDRAVDSLKRSVDMRMNADRYRKMAEALEQKGDVAGAVEVLEKLAASLSDPAEILDRLPKLRKAAYDHFMVEARKKEWVGDFEAAMDACRKARRFTGQSESVDRKITTLRRKSQRRGRFKRLQDEADELLSQGDTQGAVEKLREAATCTDKPAPIRERIQRIGQDLFRAHLAKAAEWEDEGRIEDALAEVKAAREFAPQDRVAEVEEKAFALEANLEAARKRRKVRDLLAEAEDLVRSGEVWRGIDRITAAKTWADDHTDLDRKIDETIRVEYEKRVGEAAEAEKAGELEDALQRLEGAREWAKGVEEDLKCRIDTVQARIRGEERKAQFHACRVAADEALRNGEPHESISQLRKALTFTDEPAEVEAKIAEVREGEKKKRIEEAEGKEGQDELRAAAEILASAVEGADEAEGETPTARAEEWTRRAEERERAEKRDTAFAEAEALAGEDRIPEAVARLETVRELDPTGVPERIESLLRERIDGLEEDTRNLSEGGRFEDALGHINEVRASLSFTEADWVEERIEALHERVETAQRRAAYETALAEADALAREGSERKALRRLEDARALTDDPAPVDQAEEQIRQDAFYRYWAEMESQEGEGAFHKAFLALEAAREYAPTSEEKAVEEKSAFLKEKIEAMDREEEYRRIETEGLALLEEGKPRDAIEKFLESKAFTDDPAAVDGRVSEIRESEYKGRIRAFEEALETGRLDDAGEALTGARDWGEGKEEALASLAETLEIRVEQRKKEEKFEAMDREATSLLDGGDRRGALRVLEEARPYAVEGDALQSRIDEVKAEGKREKLEASAKREAEGDPEEALAEARAARAWAEEDDEEVASRVAALEEAVLRAEREKEQSGLTEEGEQRIAAGEIQAGLEALRKAVPLAEDPEAGSKALDARVEEEVNRRLVDAETQAQEGRFDEAAARLNEAAAWDPERASEIEAKRASIEERKESLARRAEFRKHQAEAERRYAEGDVRAAFEALRIARNFAEDAGELDRRGAEMQKSTYDDYMRQAEERESRGDLEGALEMCELAREWAGATADDLEERVKAIQDRVGKRKLEQEFQVKEEEAEQLLARGYARQAVERLREAMALAPSREEVESRIAEIVGQTFQRHLKEADRAAGEGDWITAFDWLDRAREWSEGREEEVETRISRFKEEESAKEQREEHHRLMTAADNALETGRLKEGVDLLRRAKASADDPEALDQRIGAVVSRTFDELALQAVMQEEGADYEGAVLSWTEGLAWTKSAEKTTEVEGFIKRLEETISEEAPEETLERVGTLVKSLLEAGDIPGALRRYHLASRFVDSPDEAQRQVCEIAAQAIRARVEEAREAVEGGDWKTALESIRVGTEVRDAVKAPDAAVESAGAHLGEIRSQGEYLRLRAEANEKADRGDIKGALEACQEAMNLTEEKEEIQTVMVSLVESALERWLEEADGLEDIGQWLMASRLLSTAIDLFSLDDAAVASIRDKRPEVESRLKNVQYKRYIMAAAEEEAQGNLINAIEHLKHAGDFTGRTDEIEGEIARVQAVLFEQFSADLARVESEDGVEGAIRFCKAALAYFPDAAVVKRKLRDLEKQWESKAMEGAVDEHLARAKAFEKEGRLKNALYAYRAAFEVAQDTEPILDGIDRIIENLISSTLSETRNLVSRKRFREARRLLELHAQEYPESQLIRRELKAIAEAESSSADASAGQGPLTSALWDEVETPEEEEEEEGGILATIWETGEFNADDLFKDMEPVDAADTAVEPGAEEGFKPLALDLGESPEAPAAIDDDDILEPIGAPEPSDAPSAEPPEPAVEAPPEEEPAAELEPAAVPEPAEAQPTEETPAEPPQDEEKVRTVMEKILGKKKRKKIKKKAEPEPEAAPEAEAPEPTEAEAPEPAEAEAPEPAEAEAPEPVEAEAPEPAEAEAPEPVEAEALEPAEAEAPESAEAEAPEPPAVEAPEPAGVEASELAGVEVPEPSGIEAPEPAEVPEPPTEEVPTELALGLPESPVTDPAEGEAPPLGEPPIAEAEHEAEAVSSEKATARMPAATTRMPAPPQDVKPKKRGFFSRLFGRKEKPKKTKARKTREIKKSKPPKEKEEEAPPIPETPPIEERPALPLEETPAPSGEDIPVASEETIAVKKPDIFAMAEAAMAGEAPPEPVETPPEPMEAPPAEEPSISDEPAIPEEPPSVEGFAPAEEIPAEPPVQEPESVPEVETPPEPMEAPPMEEPSIPDEPAIPEEPPSVEGFAPAEEIPAEPPMQEPESVPEVE